MCLCIWLLLNNVQQLLKTQNPASFVSLSDVQFRFFLTDSALIFLNCFQICHFLGRLSGRSRASIHSQQSRERQSTQREIIWDQYNSPGFLAARLRWMNHFKVFKQRHREKEIQQTILAYKKKNLKYNQSLAEPVSDLQSVQLHILAINSWKELKPLILKPGRYRRILKDSLVKDKMGKNLSVEERQGRSRVEC